MSFAAPIAHAVYPVVAARPHAGPAPQPSLDVEMLLGFLAMVATLLCFVEQRRSRAARIALGICLLLTGIFGFARGVWPLGVLQIVWAGVAFAACRTSSKYLQAARSRRSLEMVNRRTELFGSTISNN